MRQLSLALYELRVFSHVPSKAIPRTRPVESLGRTSLAAPDRPKSRSFFSPRHMTPDSVVKIEPDKSALPKTTPGNRTTPAKYLMVVVNAYVPKAQISSLIGIGKTLAIALAAPEKNNLRRIFNQRKYKTTVMRTYLGK